MQHCKGCFPKELSSIEERILTVLSLHGRPSGRRGQLTGKPSAEGPCGSRIARGARLEKLLRVGHCFSQVSLRERERDRDSLHLFQPTQG